MLNKYVPPKSIVINIAMHFQLDAQETLAIIIQYHGLFDKDYETPRKLY